MDDLIYVADISKPSLCDEIIDWFLAEKSSQGHVDHSCIQCHQPIKTANQVTIHPSFGRAGGGEVPWVNELCQEIGLHLGQYSYRYEYCNFERINARFDIPFNIQHYRKGEGYPCYHSEWTTEVNLLTRIAVWMLYLNDVPNGGTEFLYQNRTLEAQKGKIVVWPAYWTHTHRGIVTNKHEKFIATGWVEYS